MCVICYKPIGKQFPSKTKIKTMFNNNPHGAGFMYSDGQNVYIQKGFMTLGDFNTALNKVKHHVEYPFIMHFRITTNGGTTKGLTHPFPLSADIKELTATASTTDIGIAHNGIIPLTAYATKISDTAEFIRRYMTKLITDVDDIDADMLDIIESCIDSKMAILTKYGDVDIIGKFVEDGNGILYSNTSYQKGRKKTATPKYYTATPKAYSYDTYDYMTNYPYLPNCDGYCRYCKYEIDCIGNWSTVNPYNPYNYDYDNDTNTADIVI